VYGFDFGIFKHQLQERLDRIKIGMENISRGDEDLSGIPTGAALGYGFAIRDCHGGVPKDAASQ
jgi:hypothetical protein